MTEGCLTKPNGKAAASACGFALGADGTAAPSLRRAKEMIPRGVYGVGLVVPGRRGRSVPFKFDQPGVVPLLCNAHPDMAGYIIVSPTPYFAETDDSGNYKLLNVLEGTYNLVAWHEGMKPIP